MRILTRPAERRVRVNVAGTVQGVGFRPFVYRLARSLDLEGFVRNDSSGVTIELQGEGVAIDRFLLDLTATAPTHSRIRDVTFADLRPELDSGGFAIEPSLGADTVSTSIPPDLATCGACLRELFDRADRRFRYPFINCTACGPRFTIARCLPYDRAATTMASFVMCSACQAEYDDPLNRRFHAQPNACPGCGPRVALIDSGGTSIANDDVIAAAARALAGGAIVAVKGLGGYHLACRADDAATVARLRERKQRDDKPFAVMVRGLRQARLLADFGASEARLLTSSARPIVLLRSRNRGLLAPQVAPGRGELGLVLPYTPLHHLLLADVGVPLVMTSGNRSDEPIAYHDAEALDRLGPVADLFLTHDRPIETRCEDSVMRVVNVGGCRQPQFIRRSRGFVPQPIAHPVSAASPVLGVGGQLKNTACIVRDAHAVVGPHAGDLNDGAAFGAWVHGIDHLSRLTATVPEIVAYDLHPDYASSAYALERDDLTPVGVQHHHAHLAACLAEHGEHGPALGIIFDGAGLGTDGTIWGGEILVGDLGSFERLGHLRPVRMPGGEAATREPWRMACAWLADAFDADVPLWPSLRGIVTDAQWTFATQLSRTSLAPLTSSVGRLLDACAVLCGLRPRVSYEAQAAIELEALADRNTNGSYDMPVRQENNNIVLDPRQLIRDAVRDASNGRALSTIAGRIHRGLVYAAAAAARVAAERTGIHTVVLSGGVFQNMLLLERLSMALRQTGFRVLTPRALPPNDGGLAFGQAVVAAYRMTTNVPRDSRPAR